MIIGVYIDAMYIAHAPHSYCNIQCHLVLLSSDTIGKCRTSASAATTAGMAAVIIVLSVIIVVVFGTIIAIWYVIVVSFL